MQVILKDDVVNLSYKDDIVNVKDGYGRNFLIPQGKAVIASESARKVLAENLKQRAHKLAKIKEDAQALAAKLEGVSLTIGAKTSSTGTIFGSVTNIQIAEELAKKGFEIDPTVITPKQALYMATRGGAKAQGRRDCGAIKTGNKADLVVLGTDSPNMQPCHDLMNNIVLSATDSDILMTIIDGRIVYDFGEFPTIDVEKTAYETGHAVRDILSKL